MEWISAKDRLPENLNKKVICRYQNIQDEVYCWSGRRIKEFTDAGYVIEWLSEGDGWISPGVDLIAEERKRQVEVEKWDYKHDADYENGELIGAAACYAANAANKDRKDFMRVQVHLEAESPWLSGNTGDRGDRRLRKAGWYDAWPWDAQWDKRAKHDKIRSLVIAGALIAAEIDRLEHITRPSQ